MREGGGRSNAAPSPEMQDEAARIFLAYAGEEEPILALTPEEEADLMEAQAERQRGEFASEAEVEAVFAKYPESGRDSYDRGDRVGAISMDNIA